MLFVDDVRSQFYLWLLSFAVVLLAFWIRERRRGEAPSPGDKAAAAGSG